MDSKIAIYYKKHVVDTSRMTSEECLEQGLPYLTEDGRFKNVEYFRKAGRRYDEKGSYCDHPYKSLSWVKFWQEERNRIKKGIWAGQVRVTGYHYFFMNYHRMKIVDEGYEELDLETLLSQDVKAFANEISKYGFARFMRVQYYLFHLLDFAYIVKRNFAAIKVRGMGFTEIAACHGEADALVHVGKDPVTGEIISRDNVFFASDGRYLIGADKLFDKMVYGLTFLNNNTGKGIYKPFSHTMKNDEMHWVPGYRDADNKPVKTGGEIKCVILKKPDHARAGRKNRGWWEESGANSILGPSVMVAIPLVQRLGVKTGIHIMWGTSNEDSRGISAFKDILLKPSKYNALRFRNVWKQVEKGKQYLSLVPSNPFEFLIDPESREPGVGFFVPAYEIDCLDKDGNADREKAYDKIIAEREELLSNTDDKDADVMTYIADHPIYMEEALITSKGKRFSMPQLSKHLVNVEGGLVQTNETYGYLEYVTNKQKELLGVRFIKSRKGEVCITDIPEYAIKEEGTDNLFVPYVNEIPNKLYIAGIDGIDQGKADSSGLGSSMGCVIKKRRDPRSPLNESNNSYIASYLDRPKFVDDAYEQTLCLLLFYRALGLLEYTKKGFKDYVVRDMKLGKFLAFEPSSPGEEIVTFKPNKKRRGLRATTDVIVFYCNLYERYLKDYVQNIKLLELLRQTSAYTMEEKTHYDLIAAVGMCEVLDAELRDILPKVEVQEERKMKKIGYYRDSRGYKRRGVLPDHLQPDYNKDNDPTLVPAYREKDGTIIYENN